MKPWLTLFVMFNTVIYTSSIIQSQGLFPMSENVGKVCLITETECCYISCDLYVCEGLALSYIEFYYYIDI